MESPLKKGEKRKILSLKKERKKDIKPEQEVKVFVTGVSMSGKVQINNDSDGFTEFNQSSSEKTES